MSLHYHHHLTIGFVGKRDHAELPGLEEPLKELFRAFDKRLKRIHIRLITGFADGADLIAAKAFSDVFLKPHPRKNRTIGAILPFQETDFVQTLTSNQSKNWFAQYYPCCDQQLELDGKYIAGDTDIANAVKNKAYQQQGKVLSHVADILIAVTIHNAEPKPGGTIETLLSSLYLKKPVIHFDLKEKRFFLYQSIEDWLHNRKGIEPEQILDALFYLLPTKVKFEVEPITEGGVFILRKMAWVFYERYFRRKTTQSYVVVELAILFWSLFQKKKTIVPQSPLAEFESLNDLLEHKRTQLDGPAQHFQFHYRGGYILNYFLALIAITLAVISIVVALETDRLIVRAALPWLLAVIGLVKLMVIILLIINTSRINKYQYNKKAIDYRYAAERLRINAFMGLLGILRAPKPSLGNHSRKHFEKYTGEDMYQAAMVEPLTHKFKLVVTSEKLRDFVARLKNDWIRVQLSYHRNETELMTRMDDRLEKIPAWVSVAVLAVIGVDLVMGVSIELMHIKWCPLWEERFLVAVPILLGLTAFLPAVVTTLNSIRFQSDARRLATRSAIMVDELEKIESRIDDVEHQLENNQDGSNFGSVLDIMEEAASLLTDEVAEWSLIYERRVYEQG